MEIREIKDETYRDEWNKLASHPLQAWEWGEFRAKTGVKVARYGIFAGDPPPNSGLAKLTEIIQVTIHPIPHTPWSIGYYPKGVMITRDTLTALNKIARTYRCLAIKCEPKIETGHGQRQELAGMGFVPGRSLFTRYNFVLDVTPTEEELLTAMKQKTRYNIKVATKRGVEVKIDNSPAAFKRYLELTTETTERQGFYAHSATYHRKMWETLNRQADKSFDQAHDKSTNQLRADLLTATYAGKIITTWVLFTFGDTLYYPYGASSREHREAMANNLVMWEAIKLAKKRGLTYLDMWGALGPDADTHDPWYGFHTFKMGYGARHIEYVGTWDYPAKQFLYRIYRMADWARWKVLRLLKK